MTVDVVIPFLTYDNMLTRCVNSLLNNNYIEAIFLVQNGCSSQVKSNETKKVVTESFSDARVRYLSVKEKGASYAINSVVEQSDADFIMFASSHSSFENGYVDYLLDIAEKNPDISVIGGRTVCIPRDNRAITVATRDVFRSFLAYFGTYRNLKTSTKLIPSKRVYGALYRRSELLRIGMFDTNKFRGQDFDVVDRIVRSGGKSFIIPFKDVFWFINEKTPMDLFKRYRFQALWSLRNGETKMLVAIVMLIVFALTIFLAPSIYIFIGLFIVFLFYALCISTNKLMFALVFAGLIFMYLGYFIGLICGVWFRYSKGVSTI